MSDTRKPLGPIASAAGIAASFLAVGVLAVIGRRQAGASAATAPAATATTADEIQAAALPWRYSGDRVEVMLATTSSGKGWILPKGGLKAGETLWEAAAREAKEEAGLSGSIESHEVGRYRHIKSEDGREVACEVHVFPLQVETVDADWEESDERRRRWIDPAQASVFVDEPGLAQLIADFARP